MLFSLGHLGPAFPSMTQYPSSTALLPAPTNGLAIAGFVCSIAGLVTGGLLSPIGLIVSLVALGRQPRGFAIAGVILGAAGTCGGFLILLFAGAAVLAALGLAAVALVLSEPEKIELTTDMVNMAIAVKSHETEKGSLPEGTDGLGLKPPILTDPWGSAYRYALRAQEPGFDIQSAGADQTFDTPDDVRLSALGTVWQPGAAGVQVDDDRGVVTLNFGGRTLSAAGSGQGGEVTLDLGDRVIRIVGDETGGSVTVEPPAPAAPPAPPALPAPDSPEPDAPPPP
jgi:hypothetical protein